MTATHTAGPWVSEATGSQPGAFSVVGDGQQMVALVYGANRDEQRANAYLIEAAPVMLAALKGVLDPGDEDEPSLRPEWRAVVDAIAKAEGRPVNAAEPA